MKICIVGGGNIGTAIAVELAHSGHSINVLTSRPRDWSRTLTAVDFDGRLLFDGEINLATSDVRTAIDGVDYIFVTLPSNVQAAFAQQVLPFVDDGMKFVMHPGFGGAEFIFRNTAGNQRDIRLYGLRRVHAIARLHEYGHSVWFDKKRSIEIAAMSNDDLETVGAEIGEMFDMPCETLPNYLCVTLTPSNPVLHTSRLYTMFRAFDRPFDANKLFYADWTDEASEVLFALDEEVQSICHSLDEADLRSVLSLKTHYESDTPRALTEKLRSIESLSRILSPMKQTADGWVPDFDNRYFACDFRYGLDILEQFASLLRLHAPMMNEVMSWYRRAARVNEHAIDLADFGLHSKRDIYDYYNIRTR